MNVRVAQASRDYQGDDEKEKQFTLQAGMLASTLEHSVPEHMYTDPDSATKPEGFSTAKALGMAMAQGQKIYTINQQNRNTALSNLRLDAGAMAEINSALASGKEVTAHTDPLTIAGYRGSGYVISDPVTGEGAYKISGGKNGGFLDDLKGFLEKYKDYAMEELISEFLELVKKGLGAIFASVKTTIEAWEALQDCGSEWYRLLVIYDSVFITIIMGIGAAALGSLVCGYVCGFLLVVLVAPLIDSLLRVLWEYAAESSLCKN
jgi:hypothetical protein